MKDLFLQDLTENKEHSSNNYKLTKNKEHFSSNNYEYNNDEDCNDKNYINWYLFFILFLAIICLFLFLYNK